MPETFFILLAAGILFSAAVPDPVSVTLQWLRLAGILGLTSTGLCVYFCTRRDAAAPADQIVPLVTGGAILLQLAFVQVGWRGWQRAFAVLAAVGGVSAGVILLPTTHLSWGRAPVVAGCAGVAAMTGLVLMEMLLGHAYLTASKMTISPFQRLNRVLSIALLARVALTLLACGLILARPIELFWPRQGLLLLTRWLVGLVVPAVFIWMVRDCINRRSTQSATGILYVAGVLVFIGELIALHLTRETGLPW